MSFSSSRHTGRLATLALLSGLILPALAKAEIDIQVGAYRTHGNAAQTARNLAKAGFTGIHLLPASAGTTMTKVIIGPYSSIGQANAVRTQLAARGWIGFIRNYHAPSAASTQPAAAAAAPAPSAIAAANTQASSTPDWSDGHDSSPPLTDQRFDGWRGFYQSDSAYTMPQTAHWSEMRQLFEIGSGGVLTSALHWKLNLRLIYDPLYDHSNYYPSAVRNDQTSQATLREAYLDYSVGNWNYRIGHQNIIWGEMVGLFYADVVSAKDLSQFVAQDFDLIRIPQWAIRSEYFHGNSHTELVWIPVMTYDNIGKPGGDFYPFRPTPTPGSETVIGNEKYPARNLSNSSYGARYSYLMNGWDLSGFYYHSVDASPSFFREIVSSPTPLIIYQPTHTKIDQYGLTMAKDLGPAVLKVEAVYTQDDWFNVSDPNVVNGVVQQNPLDYIAGLEHVTDSGARVNVQFFQRWFPNYNPGIIPDRLESGVSFYTSAKFYGGRLEPECLLIQSLNRNDGMARPRLTWHANGNWRYALGLDIFHGPDTGLFGEFSHSSRVVGEARYTF